MLELVLGVLIVVLVAAFVMVPLRARARDPEADGIEGELAELEARKEAKYREIRDAEADHAAGKMTDEDHRRLDNELRGEAIEILKGIDKLRQRDL